MDLNMNLEVPNEEPQIPPQGTPPVDPNEIRQQYEASQGPEAEFTATTSRTRTRGIRRQPKRQDTIVSKATLESIHPYSFILDLDEINFKDREDTINELTTSMNDAPAALDLDQITFVQIQELVLAGVVKQYWEHILVERMRAIFEGGMWVAKRGGERRREFGGVVVERMYGERVYGERGMSDSR